MKNLILVLFAFLCSAANATTICYKDGVGVENIRCYTEAPAEDVSENMPKASQFTSTPAYTLLLDFISYAESVNLKYKIVKVGEDALIFEVQEPVCK